MDNINPIEKVTRIENTMRYNLIYVFRINDMEHMGCLKIGKATAPDLPMEELMQDNCNALNKAARRRIDSYTSTAGIKYELLYTTLAVRKDEKGRWESFMDKKVHNVLLRSGYKKKTFHTSKKQTEWFVCELDIAIKAINAVKNRQQSLDPYDTTKYFDPIIFRPEQKDAIDRTVKLFKKGNKSMLWNAKMRFGKTLSTMQVVKELNFKRSIIITHRPVVADSWFDDFGKIFIEKDTIYRFGSRDKGRSIEELEKLAAKGACHYIYFASMQDLRGSEKVGGKFAKNEMLFDVDWDLVIVDEAHEGTQTALAQEVFGGIVKDKTHILGLSGTPFNLLSKYTEEEIYTWDYVMEQKAKREWDEIHEGDPNPYEGLPQLKIYTYDLKKIIKDSMFGEDGGEFAFNFREFFRVWTGDPKKDGKHKMPDGAKDKFVHEKDVLNFLNLLSDEDDFSNYPFSNETYRNYFRHSFWIVPGVKEGAALADLLRKHPVFSAFDGIINVAGNEENDDALDAVRKAITDNPDDTRTITISCGKLTTGVNVPAWTAVLYLAGSFSTAASSYMQTIFRIQTPANINGKTKEECYVFDFAPDRTLKVIAETAKISAKAGKTSGTDRVIMGEFLNFCPIISVQESTMAPFDVDSMLQKLKQVYVDRVVATGFEDVSIYNDELLKLNDIDLEAFKKLKKIIGETKASLKTNEIDINNQGFTDEEYEAVEKAKKKKKEELTEEEKALLEAAKEKKKARDTAISILRGISIRIPLLIYGANIPYGQDLTIDNFTDENIIDDKSWEEFMPKGVTKEIFNDFKKYYDQDIFVAAGNKIRRLAKIADEYGPTERIKRIADIFSTFRNPDKETVLTPWRVVNMHMSDTLGGYDFYDEDHKTMIAEPRLVNQGQVTSDVFNAQTRILEINSKTGLYPLYVAYSTFRAKCEAIKASGVQALTMEQEQEIWFKTVAENIFVVCKTKMAKYITDRTLVGYTGKPTNLRAFDDLLNQVQNKKEAFIKNVTRPNFWNIKHQTDMLKFNAIVGNPPYQLTGGSGGNNDAPIYQIFSQLANTLSNSYVSIIEPARWFSEGRENLLAGYREHMLKCGYIQKMTAFAEAREVFSNVEIKGGICYYLANKNYKGDCDYRLVLDDEIIERQRNLSEFDVLIREPRLIPIVREVAKVADEEKRGYVDSLISNDTPFGIPSNPGKSAKTPFNVYKSSSSQHDVLLYYIEKQNRKIEYAALSDLRKNTQDIDKPKVFIPGAGGSGNDPSVLGKPEVAPKHSVCSQSYLYVAFNSDEEAINFKKYAQTKFFRALVSAMKITQSCPQRAYRFVPILDFTHNADIDWSKSIPELDMALYHKYHIDTIPNAIAFIESKYKYIHEN